MTAGVALAKKEKYKKFIQYKPSSRIFKLWRISQTRKKRKAIAHKIGQKMHTSAKTTIQQTHPYITFMLKQNKQIAKEISEYFKLDKDELAWLKKQ